MFAQKEVLLVLDPPVGKFCSILLVHIFRCKSGFPKPAPTESLECMGLGCLQFSLRCGTLPLMLGMTLMMGGTE